MATAVSRLARPATRVIPVIAVTSVRLRRPPGILPRTTPGYDFGTITAGAASRYGACVAKPQIVGEQASRRPAPSPSAARVASVLATGLLAGALTSILQKYLDPPWLSLVNAASPWLAPMFAAGALWARPAVAALAGAATGLLELGGYYLTAAARGFPAGQGILVFWAACAVLGGPLFGAAGWAWWRGPARLGGLGTAALPAAFLAEAAVAYAWRLHYWSSALLFAVVAVAVFALAGQHRRQWVPAARRLPAVFAAGVAAELVLGLIYSQTF